MKCANNGTKKINGLRKPCTNDVEPERVERCWTLCAKCAKRRAANLDKAAQYDAMKSLGLRPVRGAVSGKLYWE